MPTLTRLRTLSSAVLLFCCLPFSSCPAAEQPPSQAERDTYQITGSGQPYLLYLLASPYPRLYVEVDAVEGCVPKDSALNELRAFLTAYCKKPGGIEIVRSDVIPTKAALGISPTALARKYLNGPPDNTVASPQAFLYVLFYDSDLSDKTAAGETGHPGAAAAPRPHSRRGNGHAASPDYPAAIFMNVRHEFRAVQSGVLLHEAGHVLGLVSRTTSASGYHCPDTTCLMYPFIVAHLRRLVTGRNPVVQQQLCQPCQAELAESSRKPPPTNLKFVGPVLVRSEAGYHVLGLPQRVRLIIGDLAEQDCRKFAAAERAEILPIGGGDVYCDDEVKDELLREPAKLRNIIGRAKAEPFASVRAAAFDVESNIVNHATRP